MVDRHIVTRGQATAYKVGMLEILRLREEAQRQLGRRFNLRKFHDVLLIHGAVPLKVLEVLVDHYIAQKLSTRSPGRWLKVKPEGPGVKRIGIYFGIMTLTGLGWALADQGTSSVAFRFGKKRAVVVPVKVGESTQAEFLLDTGLGFNVVSPALAQKAGVEGGSSTKVKPVTGGEFDLPQGRVSSLTLGNQSENDQPALIAEPRLFISNDGENKVDGILSLTFFREHPFTIDYANQKLIFENSDSLAKRKATGHRVECRMADESLIAAVSLALTERPPEPAKPGGLASLIPSFSGPPEPPKAWVQVNTGSEHLMLDSKLMFTLKIDDTGANVTESETTDQNGRRYRSFSSHLGKVELADNPALSQEKQPVVFRKLQTEGVLGQSFLQRYNVTFDLPNSELVFSKAGN